MGLFKSQKPRAFSHQYIYVDERKEKLSKIEENAKMMAELQALKAQLEAQQSNQPAAESAPQETEDAVQ